MRAERADAAAIVCVGNEITDGRTVNTNAAWLGLELGRAGFETVLHLACPDDPARIRLAFSQAAAEAALVLVTGGLGPTLDDITRDVAAELKGVDLCLHEPTLERLQEIFRSLGREMAQNNRRQAMIPAGADLLANGIGTAPGFTLRMLAARFFFLPGIPRELYRMWAREVLPRLDGLRPDRVVRALRLNCFGLPESTADQMLAPLFPGPSPRLAFNVDKGVLQVHLVAAARGAEEAERALAEAGARARQALGHHVYGEGTESLADVLVRALGRRELRMGFAESCTAGLAAHLLGQVPGASKVLNGGIIAYANEVKTSRLGVPEATLEAHGAVSEETALAMARGALEALDVDVAVATTGIAGPDGGSEEKPVGTVWLAVAGRGACEGIDRARKVQLRGERTWVQRLASLGALELARRALAGVES